MTENLEDILNDIDIEVFSAHEAYQAIELLKEKQIGLLLMDVKMPGMNGVETFKRIKAIHPE